jgi:hypothetical protein
MMRVKVIEISWQPDLPIFARESFLQAVGDDYGWLGGFDDSGELRCILPYTVVRKAIFRMARFRVETIPAGRPLAAFEEKDFLNRAMEFLKTLGADMIIPATTNTIFRTYPDGADAAPYGSYYIDITQPEDLLWKNVSKITRQNIRTATRSGVVIKDGSSELEVVFHLVRDTFKRSKIPFMNNEAFRRYVDGLGEYGTVLVADYQGIAQSCTVYAFSNYCAYAVYGGNIAGVQQGTMKLVQWEAMRRFRNLGVKRFDFVGARINPEPGSKQEAINSFKRRFGALLRQGYMWKFPLDPVKYRLYGLLARLRTGGDLVDMERHKLAGFSPTEQ